MDIACPLHVKIVGTYHKRPITQGQVIDFRSACNDGNEMDDLPLLLYDCNTPSQKSALIPRYIAQKTTIPTSSTSLSTVSFAEKCECDSNQIVDQQICNNNNNQSNTNNCISMCSQAVSMNVQIPCVSRKSIKWRRRRRRRLLVVTQTPYMSPLTLLFPAVLILFDIIAFIASVAIQKAPKWLVITSCMLVLIPDVLAMILLFKRGVYSTTIALHCILWSSIAIFYILTYEMLLLLIHLALMFLLTVFIIRQRRCLCQAVYTLR